MSEVSPDSKPDPNAGLKALARKLKHQLWLETYHRELMTTTGYQRFWTYNAVQARKNGDTIRRFTRAVYDHPYLGSKEFLTGAKV